MQANQTTELVTLPDPASALEAFTTPGGLDRLFDEVKQKVSGVVYDMSKKKDRDACASAAYKIARSKQAVEKVGADLASKYKEIPKLIDAARRQSKERFDALQAEIRKPLTEWEEAEALRVQSHREAIEAIQTLAANLDGRTAESLSVLLASAQAVEISEKWEEFETEAARAKDKAVAALGQALTARQQYEAEQAELTELRRKQAEQEQKDRDARIAQEAADKAHAEAEAKAQTDRDAAAQREADAKAAAERAEREKAEAIECQKQAEARAEAEKLAAEQRAKDAAEAARQAEIKRQADAQAATEAEQRRREADKAHKASINNAALAAFIENGLPEECAKQAVILIAKGVIPAVAIHY
ncbi:MAG: hypothetical protein ACTJHW_03980 [Paenalcaligenes sp.]